MYIDIISFLHNLVILFYMFENIILSKISFTRPQKGLMIQKHFLISSLHCCSNGQHRPRAGPSSHKGPAQCLIPSSVSRAAHRLPTPRRAFTHLEVSELILRFLKFLSLKRKRIVPEHWCLNACELSFKPKNSATEILFKSMWNQKRHRRLGCLSLPDPISNDSDRIFMGALFRWLVI